MPSYAKIAPQRFNERYNIYATLYGANLMGEGEIFTLLWSLMADSNCRPAHYECATLPTESIKHSIEKTGFEPVASALSGRCATTAPLLEKIWVNPFSPIISLVYIGGRPRYDTFVVLRGHINSVGADWALLRP